ncbi:MAG TPA: heavy metal-binding domain-containing protein [Lacipirellulaceae bacterium]
MEVFQYFFEFAILVGLLTLGLLAGGYAERKHLRSLASREATNGDFFVSQVRTFPDAVAAGAPPTIVFGEVTIASDYLKSFLSGLRKIFGGELRSYHSLTVRARREALQQLVESARAQGYNALCNVRMDSADIAGNSKRRSMPMVAILASATGYHRARQP